MPRSIHQLDKQNARLLGCMLLLAALRDPASPTLDAFDDEDEFDIDGEEFDIDGEEIDIDADDLGFDEELLDDDDPADD